MAAFDPETLDRWRALAIVDRDGSTVGTISEFYLDRETGHPTWALVSTGLFGATRTFVPLVHATEINDGLQVPYEKSHIKDAPSVDLHDELSPEEEAALFAHYGVEYQPSGAPAESPGPGEGPGPVAPPVPAAAADAVTGSDEPPGPVAAESATVEATETGDTERPGPPDATDGVPSEPATNEATGRDGLNSGAPTGAVPDEPGTAEPATAERGDPDGLRSEGADLDGVGPAFERRQGTPDDHSGRIQADPANPDPSPAAADLDLPSTAPPDPDLSRTAPVEPGLPGSTAASRYGPVPTTVNKGADPTGDPVDEPPPPPGETGWASGAAGSFEEQEPTPRPMGSSDRWREAKPAAERDRAARSAATRSEERSPLERARRRLERLVGGGQEPTDPDPISPADRDAAERARRARLGLDDDDNRRR
jgi:PRC-barrel domain